MWIKSLVITRENVPITFIHRKTALSLWIETIWIVSFAAGLFHDLSIFSKVFTKRKKIVHEKLSLVFGGERE